MVRYRVVRRTLEGSATLPISRSNPPESAPSERMARSGRESRYLYRAAGLTLYSIKTALAGESACPTLHKAEPYATAPNNHGWGDCRAVSYTHLTLPTNREV